jgi:hypothetical protein
MATRSTQSATNERILQLLLDIKAQLDQSSKRQDDIARDVARLLDRK